jgi:hypothetical protein
MEYNDQCHPGEIHPSPKPSSQAEQRAPATLWQGLEARIAQRKTYLTAPLAREQLLQALEQEPWEIRSAALERLIALGEAIPHALVKQALHDEKSAVRIAALRALPLSEAYSTADQLHLGLQDQDWQVREMAVLMGQDQLEDPAVRSILEQALQDEVIQVRESARQLLQFKETDILAQSNVLEPTFSLSTPPIRSATKEKEHIVISPAGHSPEEASASTPILTGTGTAPAASGLPMRHKRLPISRVMILAASLLLTLGALTAAGFNLAWWSTLFGNPDLYTTINQQQTHNGLTIKITRVYVDEGRTIIAYDLWSDDQSTQRRYKVTMYDTSGSAPRKAADLYATIGGPGTEEMDQNGVWHAYIIDLPFEVPADVNTLTLTVDIKQVIMTEIGPDAPPLICSTTEKNKCSSTPDTIMTGLWHFSFSLPFHHEKNTEIPLPSIAENARP